MNLFQVTKKQPSSGLELKTFTGNPVTFTPSYSEALPVPFNGTNLKASIVASGGNGTPSTPNPIVGHSEIHIWNNANENRFSGEFDTIVPIYLPAGATICASCSWYNSGDVKFRYYRADGTEIDYWGVAIADTTNNRKYRTFVMTENAYFCKFEGTSVTDLMVIIGSTSKPYQPYNGDTFTVSFGQTVYGGVYDANAGKVRITHAYETVSSFSGSAEGNGFRANTYLSQPVKEAYGALTCNMFTRATNYNQAVGQVQNSIGYNAAGQILLNAYINGAYITDINDINALIPAGGCQIVYELATPIEIDVSELAVDTIVGTNNITSDCGGDVEVTCLI